MITRNLSPTATSPAPWVVERISAMGGSAYPAIRDTAALRTAHEVVTYAELWERAHEAGTELSALGVGAGDIVGIGLRSCPDVVVVMLASWLVGAAILPMNAADPDEYRDRLLATSGASAVISDEGVRVLDTVRTTGPWPAEDPEQLPAYVIYTSGSTGVPKGVLVRHDALASHTAAMVDLLSLQRTDTVLQFAGLGFDVAQEEIWPTLAAGGSVAFLDSASRALSPTELARHVTDLGVSVLQLPTAYWRLVCAQMQGADSPDLSFTGVHTVVIGGEGASTKDVRAHRNSPLGHCTLINGYGPTETVVTCTGFRLRPDEPVPVTAGLPIGDPVGERKLYILDADQRPTPLATPGELWIGGSPLADGYVNDPQRTAERFRADPFTARADGRMYRTGDLVMRHQDGAVEFLGRLDNQVKVRGYRIELDEVDRYLLDVPGVTAAAALALDDGTGTGGRMLAAAVSVTVGGPTADQIVEQLRVRLPRHMIPARTDIYDRLPLTAAGKIDRRAIAAMATDPSASVGSAEPVAGGPAAGGDSLTVLLDLLRTFLRAPDFGPDDDFLARGGDSLVALRVSGSMRERGWRLRASDLVAAESARVVAARMVRA